MLFFCFFFFSSRRRHTRCSRDWSSDVCSSDLVVFAEPGDMTLLGVRTLEGFGVMVDNIAHRFVVTTTLVATTGARSEEHTSELQSRLHLVCRLLLEKKKPSTSAR